MHFNERPRTQLDDDFAKGSQALSEQLHWLFSGRLATNGLAFQQSVKKMLVLAHMVSPDEILNLDGKPMSLGELAVLLDCSQASLVKIAAEVSRRWGFSLPTPSRPGA